MTRAFTLVELLVVITIIVVLLALLVPALDKAVYQAELAVCASNMRQTLPGVTTYAVDHQRRYPHREGVHLEQGVVWRPLDLRINEVDERPALVGYVDLRLLMDPLAVRIDLSPEGTAGSTIVDTPYALWWGWRYDLPNDRLRGAMKLGDRFEGRDMAGTLREYDLLMSDHDISNPEGTYVHASHPDRSRIMAPFVRQNQQNRSQTRWENPTGPRGPIDRNVLRGDGGVQRYLDIDLKDEKMTELPAFNRTAGWRIYEPAQ